MHQRKWMQSLSGALFPRVPINLANFPKYFMSSYPVCVGWEVFEVVELLFCNFKVEGLLSMLLEMIISLIVPYRTLARYARRPHHGGPNATLLIHY